MPISEDGTGSRHALVVYKEMLDCQPACIGIDTEKPCGNVGFFRENQRSEMAPDAPERVPEMMDTPPILILSKFQRPRSNAGSFVFSGGRMPKAKNLKYLRHKAGLTQEAFAAAAGYAKSTINAWETKKRSMPKNRTLEVCEYFGVSYADFCDEDLEQLDLEYSTPLKLSAIERQNITAFRKLPADVQNAIRRIILSYTKEDKT